MYLLKEKHTNNIRQILNSNQITARIFLIVPQKATSKNYTMCQLLVCPMKA